MSENEKNSRLLENEENKISKTQKSSQVYSQNNINTNNNQSLTNFEEEDPENQDNDGKKNFLTMKFSFF